MSNIPKQSQKMSIFAAGKVDKFMALTAEVAASGQKVTSLSMGVPFYPILPEIKKELAERMETNKDFDFYSPFAGRKDLREIIAQDSTEKLGYKVKSEEILVTIGATGALLNAFAAILEDGDEVIIPSPYFFSYRQQVEFIGGKVVPSPLILGESGSYELDLNNLKTLINAKTKAILINSPHNPTGAVFSEKSLRELAALVADKEIYLITDEVYDFLVYDDCKYFNLARIESLKPYLIRCASFSKIYGVTGWRVGYLQADKEIVNRLTGFNVVTTICAPMAAQILALIGLQQKNFPSLEKHKKQFAQNRMMMCQTLDKYLDVISYGIPQGAYYIWIMYKDLNLDNYQIAAQLLKDTGISAFPGVGFDDNGPFIRFSFGGNPDEIVGAVNSFGLWLRKMKEGNA